MATLTDERVILAAGDGGTDPDRTGPQPGGDIDRPEPGPGDGGGDGADPQPGEPDTTEGGPGADLD